MFILSPDPNSAPNYIVLLFFSSPFSLFIHFIIATVHYRTNSGVSAMRTATSSFSCHLLIQGFCDSVCELIVVNINFRLKLSRMFVTFVSLHPSLCKSVSALHLKRRINLISHKLSALQLMSIREKKNREILRIRTYYFSK